MRPAIDRLTVMALLAFGVIAAVLGYWTLVRAPSILARDDNPRLIEQERRVARGTIYDRQGNVLAESVQQPDGTYLRHYPHPQAAQAVGYYSLRYGASGAEASYDAILRGTAQYSAWDRLLHRPQVGGDVHLTLDLNIQTAVAGAMADTAGAAIVIEADTGEVLALVSSPTFDPNTLDENWDNLVGDRAAPLLNRVTQGRYQPGAVLQTVVLAAALERDIPSAIDPEQAAAPYPLDLNGATITLTCGRAPSTPSATLVDAYVHACPAPFAALGEALGEDVLSRVFADFGLFAPPRLFTEAVPEPLPLPSGDPAAMSLGQGRLTVSPAQMVRVAAVVANGGYLPSLTLEAGVLGVGEWLHEMQHAVIAPGVAAELQSAMRQAMNAHDAADIAGHAGLALSGPEEGALSWFIGFAARASGAPLAVAVVLEDTADISAAADIGRSALRAAQSRP